MTLQKIHLAPAHKEMLRDLAQKKKLSVAELSSKIIARYLNGLPKS